MTNIQSSLRMGLSTPYLMAQLDTLNNLGFSYKQSFEALGYDEKHISDASLRIPVDTLLPLFSAAEKALGNPLIGLETGFRFRIGTFAKTGAVYSFCRDLKQVIGLNRRYQGLAIDTADITYDPVTDESGDTHHYMRFDTYYNEHEKYRHITDMVMGSYGTAYRWLSWGSGEDIKAVHLPYAAPPDIGLYERVFLCDIIFDAPIAALEFTEKMMTAPLTTHDPDKLALLIAKLDSVSGHRNAQLSLKTAIEAAMRIALQKGTISSAILANRLSRSERQFRQDMKAANISYRQLLDEVRQKVFLEKYEAGESFASIAQSLSYNDQPAFNRAFRRWYDLSPREWALKRAEDDNQSS